jgi:uncharacterized protein YqeY
MSMQVQIKNDLKSAMKAQETSRVEALRVILGEFSRMESKLLDDEAVIRILKKLEKSEREVLERQGTSQPSTFLMVITSYLPQTVSEAEIEDWIRSRIDFSQYPNKMQAMGEIMRHFGARADGRQVKAVLQSKF